MSILKNICQELDARRNLALVHIVEGQDEKLPVEDLAVEKQLPQAIGRSACMLVGERGLVAGTLGGGDLEARAIEAGMRVAEKGVAEFLDCDDCLADESRATSGMDHGHRLRLFIEPLRPEPRTSVLYKRLSIALACGDNMFSVTPVRAPGQRLLCRTGMRTWPVPSEIAFLLRQKLEEGTFTKPSAAPFELKDSMGQRFVVVPWPAPWRLVLAGSDHVARAIALRAARMDFAVCVLCDDTECEDDCDGKDCDGEKSDGKECDGQDVALSGRFPMADVLRSSVEDGDCFAGMSLEDNCLVVVLARNLPRDRTLIAQALRSKARCICLTGTRKELDALVDHLRTCGDFTEQELARVTALTGLDIGAEPPEEVAASIMAQLVAIRARMRGRQRQGGDAGQEMVPPNAPTTDADR